MYTHMLSYKLERQQRISIIKQLIRIVSQQCTYLKTQYWPGEKQYEHLPHYINSLYGIEFLQKHRCPHIPEMIDEHGVSILYCCINQEIISYFDNYNPDGHFVHTLHFFHLEFQNSRKETILCCGDHGDDIVLNAHLIDSAELDDIISKPFFNVINISDNETES